jgi:hypothetical protein
MCTLQSCVSKVTYHKSNHPNCYLTAQTQRFKVSSILLDICLRTVGQFMSLRLSKGNIYFYQYQLLQFSIFISPIPIFANISYYICQFSSAQFQFLPILVYICQFLPAQVQFLPVWVITNVSFYSFSLKDASVSFCLENQNSVVLLSLNL